MCRVDVCTIHVSNWQRRSVSIIMKINRLVLDKGRNLRPKNIMLTQAPIPPSSSLVPPHVWIKHAENAFLCGSGANKFGLMLQQMAVKMPSTQITVEGMHIRQTMV